MIKKIFAIMILIILISGTYVSTANEIIKDVTETEVISIKVALYTDEIENEEFYSVFKRTCYFVYALRDYQWIINNKKYYFKVDLMSRNQLFLGKLNIDNYDVLIYPPDQVKDRSSLSHYLEQKMIKRFIEAGGGYFGTCASGLVLGDLENIPDTNLEKSWSRCVLKISEVNVDFNADYVFFNQLKGGNPEDIGPTNAYYSYSGWNQSNMNLNYHSGYCVDCPVNNDHPIFKDYNNDIRRMRIIGGNSFVIPDNTKANVTVLASFPDLEVSDNVSLQIHYWKYVGGLKGIIKAIITNNKLHYGIFRGFKQNILMYSGDWIKTDKIVETDLAGKPCMISEIYPNENEARIIRCSGHPEHNVWWGGHIVENDTDFDNIYEAFYHWEYITPEEETSQDEFSYNHGLIRRSIAYAAKINDECLPPIE